MQTKSPSGWLALFRIAEGSVAEVRACIDTAEALGGIEREGLEKSLAFIDRMQAMCWRLTH